jgi:hypothetical protein
VSFIQNDPLSDSGLQEGADCIRVSSIDGGGLSIWAPDFRERVPRSRSTFWWSLAWFEHLLHPSQIIELSQLAGRTTRTFQQPRGVEHSSILGILRFQSISSLWRHLLY